MPWNWPDEALDLLATWAVQRSHDLGNGKIFLPLRPITGIISFARSVEPEEARQAVRTKLSVLHFQRITLELLVGHVLDGRHTRPRNHSIGFKTRTRDEPGSQANSHG